MSAPWASGLLAANLTAHALLLGGAVWSIGMPRRRIYPMPERNGWYWLMWLLFAYVFLTNALFVVLDWNAGLWTSPLRFWVAAPLVLLGTALVGWGIATLGVTNTSALPAGFVARGPYLLTRNPQYLGDVLLFAGIVVAANSGVVLTTNALSALVLILAPWAEEPWLVGQYGDRYVAYRREVPRFL